MTASAPLLSASLICADILNLQKEVGLLEQGRSDFLHCDVMDGVFVPRYGLHPEFLQAVHALTSVPVDVHLMVHNAEPYIPVFAEVGAEIITVHVEGNLHLERTLGLIRKCGKKVGVALNAATKLDVLDYVLDEVDWVLIMGINPGILGDRLWPFAVRKIAELRMKLADRTRPKIQVDGGVTFESAPQMIRAGADMLVCGSATIFRRDGKTNEWLHQLRQTLPPRT